MASKGAPKFSKAAAAKVRARAAGVSGSSTKGTFGKGSKSATSSNATRKPGAFSNIKPKGKGGGGKQRRDGKGRFA